jgi:site-specific recombinase XerD
VTTAAPSSGGRAAILQLVMTPAPTSGSPLTISSAASALSTSTESAPNKLNCGAVQQNAAAVSAHWLRHDHASHALDNDGPIHLVQQTLGHNSLATTSRYVHARPDDSGGRYLGL